MPHESAAADRPARVVVVGASAGGVEGIATITAGLPADFPAAVLVTLHTSPRAEGRLPEVLRRSSRIAVAHARDGEPLRGGRVYVAPPDRHLLVEEARVRLGHGPRENGTRPAVDPMFRSAARAHGPATVGVVLTGTLDNGTAGLLAVELAGGVTVVQDPDDALFDDMPRHALEHVDVDHVLPLAEIAPLLRSLAGAPAGAREATAVRGAAFVPDPAEAPIEWNEASGLTCPDCDGALWEVDEPRLTQFRCRIGHVYSPETLLEEFRMAGDAATEAALRTLEEQVAIADRLVERARATGRGAWSLRKKERIAREARARLSGLRAALKAREARGGEEVA